jgi:MSHA biogenesis protein MshP
MRPRHAPRPRARGFGALAAILVLVVLAGLAGAVLRLGQASQLALAQDVAGTRAAMAARAGLDWGLYQAFKGGWTTCAGTSQTLDLRADFGVWVTVSCQSDTYREGETAPGTPRSLRVYTLDAVACNGATSCPDNTAATALSYVERRRQVQATGG